MSQAHAEKPQSASTASSIFPTGDRPAGSFEGGVAGAGFSEDFESGYSVGLLDGINGWTGSDFGANMYVSNQAGVIQGTLSAIHVSDGTGIPGFELDSPNFGPSFGSLALQLRLTGSGSLYQLVSLDTDTGVFNTRVNLNTDGSVEFAQLDVDAGAFAFFDTGKTAVVNTIHDACIDIQADGTMTLTWDGEVAAIGVSASQAAYDSGLIPNGMGDPVPAGHGQYRTFTDNVGTGAIDDNGTPGDLSDDIALGTGDNLWLDVFSDACDGLPGPSECAGDTNGDNTVNVTDLVNVILDWGTDGSGHGGDLAGASANDGMPNGIVDVADLVTVILNWANVCVGGSVSPETCDDALFIFFAGSVGFETGAALDGGVPSCETGATNDVYYKYIAQCNADTLTINATFDGTGVPWIEVYQGTDCPPTDPSPACSFGAPVVLNSVPEGTALLIRVGGTSFAPPSDDTGTITVDVMCEVIPPPANDDCADAEDLVLPASVSSSTVSATEDPEAFTCGDPGVAPGAPGIWYHMVGTGQTITASMCASPTPYDAILQVYCGATSDCGVDEMNNLLCAVADDDGCGMLGDGTVSVISWCSGNGQDYLIRVAGFGTSTGDFQLDVSAGAGCATPQACTEPIVLANDDCINAIAIADGITSYDNSQATTDGPAHPECEVSGDGGQTTEDVWYLYTATLNGVAKFTTCEEEGGSSNYDSDIVVYGPFANPINLATACDEASLLANFLGCNDDDPLNECGTGGGGFHSTLTVPVNAGDQYIVRVGGWFTGNVGQADLLVSSFVPDNDLCDFADPVTLGVVTPFNTAGASADAFVPLCPEGGATPPDSPGRWFSVIGDGTTYTAELCGVDFGQDTRLAVYCGPCAELGCAADEDPDNNPVCGPNETLSWCTFPGSEYLILVFGNLTGVSVAGDLTVTSNSTPCSTPACLPPDECGGDYSQPRRLPDDAWTFGTSDLNIELYRHDNFPWAGGNITSVRWWGIDARFVTGAGFAECNDASPLFEIQICPSVAGPNGPLPDTDNPISTQFLDPSKVAADEYAALPFQNWEYTATLDTPVSLAAGDYWMSIRDADGDVCFFLWLDSRIGDDIGVIEDVATGDLSYETTFDDLSMCINPTL